MDRKIEKKAWYIRHKFTVAGGILFCVLIGWVMSVVLSPRKLRVDKESVRLAEVKRERFLEYVDVEGIVHPILTLKVFSREGGMVERIVAENGAMLQQGDTILVLDNPDLVQLVEEQQEEWERQRAGYEEKRIEMEQKSLSLRQQVLQTRYELDRLEKSYRLTKEEYSMGIKSRAQLELAEDEYTYKRETALLQMENLAHDSVASLIRQDLLKGEPQREYRKFMRTRGRLEELIVRAPIDGQLSFVQAIPGQRISPNEGVGEIKVLSEYKITTTVSEYYVDRIIAGLPATLVYQEKNYPLRVSKVIPEVKERTFSTELVFTEEMPENIRIGQSFRIQIEMGDAGEELVIPKGNFYPATGGQWIYKVNSAGTKAVKVPLVLGRQNPRQYEITEGLQPGDWVIITGYDTFGQAEELILK